MDDPSERRSRSAGRIAGLAAISALVVCVGQADRALLMPDDLREVEVAREIDSLRDAVVPHLAGLPFVEKPPGFQVLVHEAFRLAGGPSATAARAVAAAFAFATLGAVFLLGRAALGSEAGALAACLLALASRFCRTAHMVLLDNALVAANAFAMWCAWRALGSSEPSVKRRWYAGTAFCLGLAFLFKGPIGPLLFGTGFAIYLALTRRAAELREALRPLAVAAFVVPVALWLVPFLREAPAPLLREFFVANQFGRFFDAYESHPRPPYFYLFDLGLAFLPFSILLPAAVLHAVRARRSAPSPATTYFIAMAIGPLLLLSLSRAKTSVYLLPAHPALALLVAAWADAALDRPDPLGAKAIGGLALFWALLAVVASVCLGAGAAAIALAAGALLAAALWMTRAWRRGAARDAMVGALALTSLGWCLWFTGPIRELETKGIDLRPAVASALTLIGDRCVLLFRPHDGLRGAMGFYANRTPREFTRADALPDLLAEQPGGVLVVRLREPGELPGDLLAAAERAGRPLERLATLPLDGEEWISLYTESSRSSAPEPPCGSNLAATRSQQQSLSARASSHPG